MLMKDFSIHYLMLQQKSNVRFLNTLSRTVQAMIGMRFENNDYNLRTLL
jgi:hypothetical protein